MNDDLPERRFDLEDDPDEEPTLAEDRPVADWLEVIGPEEMDPDEVMDNLEEYGFEKMDEGMLISNPLTVEDMPTWMESETAEGRDVNELLDSAGIGDVNEEETLLVEGATEGDSFRPVEDQVLDELDDETDTPAA